MKQQNLTDHLTPPAVVVGTKKDAKPLRWVASATVTPHDNRPALNCLYVDGAVTVATDGFRLHVIPTPPMIAEYNGQMIYSDWPAAGKQATVAQVQVQVQVLDANEYHYPAYMSIVKSAQNRPDPAKCYVSGKYLADFCAGLGETDMVEITLPEAKPVGHYVHSAPPITLATVQNPELRTDTPKRWALIMPMNNFTEGLKVYNPFETGDK